MKRLLMTFAFWLATPVYALTVVGDAVPIYTEDQLSAWFTTNQHLRQVKADDCQLVQDIQARAQQTESPTYQFLYGDMLAWCVCSKRC